MIARVTLVALAATMAGGCATRHASQPVLHGVTDTTPYEVKRSGNMVTRYSYTRNIDGDESLDLTPLFDHYDETYEVRRTATIYEKIGRWATPIAMAAGVTGSIAAEANGSELIIASLTSTVIGLVVSTAAHLFGQNEYGKLGDMYNERLREEAAGN